MYKLTKASFVSSFPSGFDELTCHCGASVIYPPVPCGTRPPECTQTCARIHECDHPVYHSCHSEEKCPPCTFLTQKWCMGKHEELTIKKLWTFKETLDFWSVGIFEDFGGLFWSWTIFYIKILPWDLGIRNGKLLHKVTCLCAKLTWDELCWFNCQLDNLESPRVLVRNCLDQIWSIGMSMGDCLDSSLMWENTAHYEWHHSLGRKS